MNYLNMIIIRLKIIIFRILIPFLHYLLHHHHRQLRERSELMEFCCDCEYFVTNFDIRSFP